MFTFLSLPGSSLLDFDGIRILVNVGSAEQVNAHVSTLNLVLLTHATIEHLGAYSHCCQHIPGFSRIPCYATTPVINLGRTLTVDLYGSTPRAPSNIPDDGIYSTLRDANLVLPPPTTEEIATHFSLINPLKYSQPHQPAATPSGPDLSVITITAYSAGHSLGGTIWHIQHGMESVVYAVDWSLARENFLPGAAWLSGGEVLEALHKPTAMICSSRGLERPEALPRQERDDRLKSLIRETISQGGKVLIPTDSSARVLELAFLLERTWRENVDGPHADTYRNARIYMASKSCKSSVKYLQSMLEWMEESVIRDAEASITKGEGQAGGSSSLNWKHVHQIERSSQVERALRRHRPCVILASDTSVDWGYSYTALQWLSQDSRNLVVLTETGTKPNADRSGLSRQLWELYNGTSSQSNSQSGAKVVNADGHEVELRESRSEALNAEESSIYQQYLARQRQMHGALQGDSTLAGDTTADLGDDQASESSDSEDEGDGEHQGRAFNVTAQLTQTKRKPGVNEDELGVNILLRGKEVYDYDVRNKRGREKMFPFVAHRHRDDEFGDVIKLEDYLRAEERDDIDGVDVKVANAGTQDGGAAVGQKRKWDESTNANAGRGRGQRNTRGQNKRAKPESKIEPDDIDAIIAKATGEDGSKGVNGTAENSDDDESDESEYEPVDDDSSEPHKIVFTTRTLSLSLRVAYVDFTGLYRLPDIQGLIGRINPRKLIVTAGSPSETRALADTCRDVENGSAVGEIFVPVDGEVIDASVDTNAWTVKLTRQLARKIQWNNLGADKPSIAAISGILAPPPSEEATKVEEEDETAKKKLKMSKTSQATATVANGTDNTSMPILDVPDAYTSIQNFRAAQPVHVGDLRLSELRQYLRREGHQADFRGGGTLLVDGTVFVKKNPATGGIELEAATAGLSMPEWGTSSKEGSFYAVKKAIFQQLAAVAGA